MPEPEITKEKILSFCQERFFASGFSNISVDDIATDLRISKKTFYKHFTGKEDLVHQIMERFMGGIRTNSEQIVSSDRSAVQKLSEIITLIATNAGRLTPAFGQDIQRRMPELWGRIQEFRKQRISDIFSRLIRQGVMEGTMRADMNNRVFLLCVLSAIEGIMQPHLLAHESFSIRDAVQEILGIFFCGGLTEQGRTQYVDLQKTLQQPL